MTGSRHEKLKAVIVEFSRSVCRDSQQLAAGVGQNTSQLLARCAGVHVDLHANRHFNDLWSLPSHLALPSDGATLHRRERKTDARLTQGSVRRMSQIGLLQQTKQGSPCRRSQFADVKRSVGVPVGCIETLLDDGQIFVQRQGPVVVRICCSKLACRQTPGQFAFVECAVVVRIKPRKQLCGGFLDLAQVERSIGIQIERLDGIAMGGG